TGRRGNVRRRHGQAAGAGGPAGAKLPGPSPSCSSRSVPLNAVRSSGFRPAAGTSLPAGRGHHGGGYRTRQDELLDGLGETLVLVAASPCPPPCLPVREPRSEHALGGSVRNRPGVLS